MPGKNSIPSVTEILGVYVDFSRVRPDVLQRAADRGTAVHQACAAIASGLCALSLPQECRGYIQSFEKWFELVDMVHMVEKELVHSVYGYMGHLDLCVTLRRESHPRVIDIKTPVTEGPTWKAQIAAYEALVIDNADLEPQRSGSLRLRPDGGFPKYTENTKDTRAFNAFLNALAAYRYFKM